MTEEMQKTKGCLQKDRTETKEYAGVQTVIGISHESLVEVNLSSEMLLETVMSRGNMNAAYKRVMSNKGSGGVDNMGLDELLPYLKSHEEELTASILNGRYKPNPVRRVEIPKDNGKKRQLGIPTLVDRVIQQSLSQVYCLQSMNRSSGQAVMASVLTAPHTMRYFALRNSSIKDIHIVLTLTWRSSLIP